MSTKYLLSYCFFYNLFIFKEKQWQIQIQKITYDMHMQFYLDKRHLIYKTILLQHYTEISITKDSFKWQPFSTCMVVFSILIQYFRYFIPPFIWVYHPNIYIYINNTLNSKCLDYYRETL